MPYTLHFGEAVQHLPYLLGGAVISLEIAFLSFWCGAVIGLFGAAGKTYGGRLARGLIGAYVTFFTNTPAFVQIFFLLWGLPEFGIVLSPFQAVAIGITVNSGAYLTEILRAGFLSVHRAEIEAAETLGMSRLQTVRYVILPHIAKTIYAPLANLFIWLVLGSAMAALFGVEELTGRTLNITTENLRTIEMFSLTAAIYIVMTIAASTALALVGRWAFRVKAKVF